ncbi:MAG: amicyanin, partial [Proteobacteria bacterium]|nr:amicyanin [Pseudomonadota bacterium]
TNHDQTPHTIKARDGGFASSGMDTGDTYAHTFTTAGDYTYFCTLHPFMIGIVHVRQ